MNARSIFRGRSVKLALAVTMLWSFFTAQIFGQAITGLKATRIATGLGQILFVASPPQDYNRLFIVNKTGQIYILNLATNAINATPFLDLSSRVSTSSEEGLVGLAFDPNYAANGKFYTYYVVPGGSFGQGITRISQFQVSSGNPDLADVSSEKILLAFDQPQANHNGGWIGFSPRAGDGNNLYIASGDGGNANDSGTGHIEPGGNAQNLTSYMGKMLRIHVDAAAGVASIPADNPFAGSSTAKKEIFTYGLRNPFRDSFDRATGDLFLGDVGQDNREEVDVQKASNPGGGENYGWRLREGTIATPTGGVGGAQPTNGVDPIIDYPRSTGGTVTGGYVYRGKQIPALRGTYVFGDYLVSKIFVLNFDGTKAVNFQDITSQMFPTSVGNYSLSNPASFGEDANGEIYIVAIGSGSVFRIEPVTAHVETLSINHTAGSSAFISALGVPFKIHSIQAANTLVEQFTTIGTATAAGNGLIQYEDTGATGALRFYRVTYP